MKNNNVIAEGMEEGWTTNMVYVMLCKGSIC